jgi:hypothetical protein
VRGRAMRVESEAPGRTPGSGGVGTTLLLQAASSANCKDSNEPSRSALLDFYVEIERIAQHRRRYPPKAQEPEAQPEEVCHVVADPA